jgi:hypothetical protein
VALSAEDTVKAFGQAGELAMSPRRDRKPETTTREKWISTPIEVSPAGAANPLKIGINFDAALSENNQQSRDQHQND